MPMSPSAATTLSNVLAAAANEGFDANGRRINPAPAKQPRSAGGGSRPAPKPAKLSLGGGGIKKGKGRGKVVTPRPQATKAKGKQQHPANWSENTELTDLAATSAAATPDQQQQQQQPVSFSCHYCRQKRADIVTCNKQVEGHRWCGSCIRNHLGEDLKNIRDNKDKLWPAGCPRCTKTCTCSHCRVRDCPPGKTKADMGPWKSKGGISDLKKGGGGTDGQFFPLHPCLPDLVALG